MVDYLNVRVVDNANVDILGEDLIRAHVLTIREFPTYRGVAIK